MRNPDFKTLYPTYRTIWWDSIYNPLGNDWEPLPFPEKRLREYEHSWLRFLVGPRGYWLLRNPFHNFFAHWIGFLGHRGSVMFDKRYGSDNRHIEVRVTKADKLWRYFPALSVRIGWFEGFIGWRVQGQFQIQANLEHRKPDEY